ncbi:MAG: hypothetical protein M3N32_07415 [Actinomycetota bacterium]|nr:hypothetical protein [Actinomycetota bacterium]
MPDTDDDGTADRMGESDAGDAPVHIAKGETYEDVGPAVATSVKTGGDMLTFTMRSDEPDCGVPVVFFQ